MVFSSHRELNGWRPSPKLDEHGKVVAQGRPQAKTRWSEWQGCAGQMVVDPETQQDEIWIAECDMCGFTIGIPPRASADFFQDIRS